MSVLPPNIGPYQVQGVVGRGGMGVVYRCSHVVTGESVAVKTVNVLRESLLAGLRCEIHALAQIRHPGVVRILDEGIHRGIPWYAMELLHGSTFRQITTHHTVTIPNDAELAPTSVADFTIREPIEVDGYSLPRGGNTTADLGLALGLIRKLCDPLAFLHGEGIVHRDLKPDNIFVQAGGNPVLVDFGIASQFAGREGREPLDLASRTAGTLAYMAPEQLLGERVDARADLYSLGCILYEIVTGCPPFVGSHLDVVRHHMETEPTSPSQRAPGTDERLERLILRLLAKNPRMRLGYADDVARALEEIYPDLAHPPEPPRPRPYLYRPGFTGREEALGSLVARIREIRDCGGLALIAGESGVGKTRFAVQAAIEAESNRIRVISSECLPVAAGASPLNAFRGFLLAIADRCRERGKAEVDRLLGARSRLLSLYEPAIAALPGLDAYPSLEELAPDAARLRLFSYVAETLAAVSSDQPIVLAIDDLQWADDLSLDCIEFLVSSRAISKQATLLLAAYRSEERSESIARLRELPDVWELELERLDEHAIGSIADDMLALYPSPADLVAFLSTQSEGNPFFAAEYLRAAVEAGLLARDEHGSWQLVALDGRPGYDRLGLPGSLRSLVSSRLDSLPEPARRLVSAAAVLGRESSIELLRQVCRLTDTETLEATSELLRRNVLEETALGSLRFTHDKIREAAYDSLSDEQRISLHRASAEALEATPAVQAGPADIGFHWEHAGVYARAAERYLEGARLVRSRSAFAEAERLYRSALRAAEAHGVPTPTMASACNRLGEMLHLLGRVDEAIAVLKKAHSIASQQGLARIDAWVLLTLGTIHRESARSDDAQSAFTEALKLARQTGDQLLEANFLRSVGILQYESDRPLEARESYERALQIFRAWGDRRMEGILLANIASFEMNYGQISRAHELYAESIAIHREVGNRRFEGNTLMNLAGIVGITGRYQESISLMKEALAIHREVGNKRHEGVALGNIGSLLLELGQVEEAIPYIEECLEIVRAVCDRRAEANNLLNLGNALAWLGREDEARKAFVDSHDIHRKTGNRRSVSNALSNRARFERRVGQLVVSEQLTSEAESLARESNFDLLEALCWCERGHLALAAGDTGGARNYLESARRKAESLGPLGEGELASTIDRLEHSLREGAELSSGECTDCLPQGFGAGRS